MTNPPDLALAAVWTFRCGGIQGLITAPDGTTVACGITCGTDHAREWWCECGPSVSGPGYIGPDDVCPHLRVLGSSPREEVQR